MVNYKEQTVRVLGFPFHSQTCSREILMKAGCPRTVQSQDESHCPLTAAQSNADADAAEVWMYYHCSAVSLSHCLNPPSLHSIMTLSIKPSLPSSQLSNIKISLEYILTCGKSCLCKEAVTNFEANYVLLNTSHY